MSSQCETFIFDLEMTNVCLTIISLNLPISTKLPNIILKYDKYGKSSINTLVILVNRIITFSKFAK